MLSVLAFSTPAAATYGWYKLDPSAAFQATFDYNDYNTGGCNWDGARGVNGDKQEKYLHEPYISTDYNSITATIPSHEQHSDACIYQHTQDTCSFYQGLDGVIQMDFDYEFTGDALSNRFAFWINSRDVSHDEKHGYDENRQKTFPWIKEAEVDPLEMMNQWASPLGIWMNYAGWPGAKQAPIPSEYQNRGHISIWFGTSGGSHGNGVIMRACAYGKPHPDDCNGLLHMDDPHTAKIDYSSSIIEGIQNKEILHHLVIDYWFAQAASSLKIENIHMYFNRYEESQCPMAQKLYSSVLPGGVSTGPTLMQSPEGSTDLDFENSDDLTDDATDENSDDVTDVTSSESSSSSSDDSEEGKPCKGGKKHGKKPHKGRKKRGPKERMGELVDELSL